MCPLAAVTLKWRDYTIIYSGGARAIQWLGLRLSVHVVHESIQGQKGLARFSAAYWDLPAAFRPFQCKI
jgi:hypothetical protein